ncbi:MAG: carbon starvation protein A, partial [Bacteroidales bacterium]|nr:carbon starvation protein A [Bacteroidales bacterium]
MITFLIAIAALVLGYFLYGKFIDTYFGADRNRKTPAISQADGIDYKVLSPWRIFIIQFLNIAGLGPIFGAVLGAAYGPVAYVWIVLGCIFMGAAHDYMSGMLSIRNGGKSLPDIVGQYLGKNVRRLMVFFTGILLMAVGASFVNGPAGLLANLTDSNMQIWLYVVFAYYIIATMLPIDKIIGKIYPFMGAALLFMAVGIGI